MQDRGLAFSWLYQDVALATGSVTWLQLVKLSAIGRTWRIIDLLGRRDITLDLIVE